MDKIEKLTKEIVKFRDKRDWKQFHTLENLAKSISIESAELLECFQWNSTNVNKEEIEDELADIAIYLYLFANKFDVDLEKIINKKIDKNQKKYPVKKAKGKSTKYDKL